MSILLVPSLLAACSEKEEKKEVTKTEEKSQETSIEKTSEETTEESVTEEADSSDIKDAKAVDIADIINSKERKVLYLVRPQLTDVPLSQGLKEDAEFIKEAKSKASSDNGWSEYNIIENSDLNYPISGAILIENGKSVKLNVELLNTKYFLTDFLEYSIDEQFDKLLKLQKMYMDKEMEKIDRKNTDYPIFTEEPMIYKFKEANQLTGVSILWPEFNIGIESDKWEDNNVTNELIVDSFTSSAIDDFNPDYDDFLNSGKYKNFYISGLEETVADGELEKSDQLIYVSDKNEQIVFSEKKDGIKVIDKSESKAARDSVEDSKTDLDNL